MIIEFSTDLIGCVENTKFVCDRLTELYFSQAALVPQMVHSSSFSTTPSTSDHGLLSSGHSNDLHIIINEWEYLPPVGSRPSGGFVGLKNAGATCYMNSVLQQVHLFHFLVSLDFTHY